MRTRRIIYFNITGNPSKHFLLYPYKDFTITRKRQKLESNISETITMADKTAPVSTPASVSTWKSRWPVIVLGVLLLAALLAIAVLATRLSSAGVGNDRTISVSGEAVLEAEPDQYLFYPSYTIKNADQAAALAEAAKKSDEVVAGLKQVGVADKDIKTNSNGYDAPVYYDRMMPEGGSNYNVQLTVTVRDKALAQKVQDYLLTTTPSGAVTPQTSFSDAKRKELENKARDQATKEARSKADQTAANLGFKVGKVKSVADGSGFGVQPYDAKTMVAPAEDGSASSPQLGLQPGQDELRYSVTVVYTIR